MNNVAKYRSKAKLSQRALASLVGVSQQTIQRIEAEVVTVRFETAIALASALKAPLKSLFPEMRERAALESRQPQRPEEAIDYSHCSHTLKMQFAGGPMCLYSIDEATASRVRSCLFSEKDFVVFDTATHSVAVNSRKLLWTNILFDPGMIEADDDAEPLGPLTMYFDDSADPHTFDIDPDHSEVDDEDENESGSQLQQLIIDLDGLGDANGIMSFVDGDGEEVIFNPARMKALEIPLAAVNPKLFNAIIKGLEEDEPSEASKPAD